MYVLITFFTGAFIILTAIGIKFKLFKFFLKWFLAWLWFTFFIIITFWLCVIIKFGNVDIQWLKELGENIGWYIQGLF
jgi:hypothetical protein